MTCKKRRVRGLNLHPTICMTVMNTELSSHEGTRGQFNGCSGVIKLGIDVHQAFYVVVVQEGGSNPKPAQRFRKAAFLAWATRLKAKHPGAQIHAVYEACGFGFGLQRQLAALGVTCQVACPQKLDERQQRVKTDGRDARDPLPEAEPLCGGEPRGAGGGPGAERRRGTTARHSSAARATGAHAQTTRGPRAQLDGQPRVEPMNKWWKQRAFATLGVPAWLRELLGNTQPLLLASGSPDPSPEPATAKRGRTRTSRAAWGRSAVW